MNDIEDDPGTTDAIVPVGPVSLPPFYVRCPGCSPNIRICVNEPPPDPRCPRCGELLEVGENVRE